MKTRPRFLEFYKAWRSDREKEQLTLAAEIAVVVLVGSVAQAVQDDHTRRAVKEELDRRGL